MKVVILTGGIGTGKTTVTDVLEKRGAAVIRADEISRRILKKGEPGYAAVVNTFGSGITDSRTGEIDRAELSKTVFGDPSLLEKLNAVTHPLIYEEIGLEIGRIAENAAKQNNGCDLTVVEIPLLQENEFNRIADEIWAVTCDEKVRIERLCEGRGFTEDGARARIASQPSEEEYAAAADLTIDNSGSPEDMESQIDDILERKGLLKNR